MGLPRIVVPEYSLILPSNGKEIKYRPFLVKEEKLLLIAMESDDEKEIVNATKNVIKNCVFGDINVDELPIFDIEYIFLWLRGRAKGEKIELKYKCPSCDSDIPLEFNIENVKVIKQEGHDKKIELTNDLGVMMKYPDMLLQAAIEKTKDLVDKLSNTESRVFIVGPAGSGKELVARQIHKKSLRSKEPFVIVNGALLDPEKYELELFGTENSDGIINYGFFEKAKNGTMLIDEVSEIPLKTQAKILRVLIDQKFKRVNGFEEINVNVRILSTSSKNIREEVDKGNFREDLYHRLNVVPIFLPALKDRTEDIPLLLNYFSKKIAELNGINQIKLDTDFDLYYKYDWPGNVRELRNLVERISILSHNENKNNINQLVFDAISPKSDSKNSDLYENVLSYPLKEAREKFEKNYLTSQLKKHKGNISKNTSITIKQYQIIDRSIDNVLEL